MQRACGRGLRRQSGMSRRPRLRRPFCTLYVVSVKLSTWLSHELRVGMRRRCIEAGFLACEQSFDRRMTLSGAARADAVRASACPRRRSSFSRGQRLRHRGLRSRRPRRIYRMMVLAVEVMAGPDPDAQQAAQRAKARGPQALSRSRSRCAVISQLAFAAAVPRARHRRPTAQ
jgi:hypothetical protein